MDPRPYVLTLGRVLHVDPARRGVGNGYAWPTDHQPAVPGNTDGHYKVLSKCCLTRGCQKARLDDLLMSRRKGNSNDLFALVAIVAIGVMSMILPLVMGNLAAAALVLFGMLLALGALRYSTQNAATGRQSTRATTPSDIEREVPRFLIIGFPVGVAAITIVIVVVTTVWHEAH